MHLVDQLLKTLILAAAIIQRTKILLQRLLHGTGLRGSCPARSLFRQGMHVGILDVQTHNYTFLPGSSHSLPGPVMLAQGPSWENFIYRCFQFRIPPGGVEPRLIP